MQARLAKDKHIPMQRIKLEKVEKIGTPCIQQLSRFKYIGSFIQSEEEKG
jgi:hypothetical protein